MVYISGRTFYHYDAIVGSMLVLYGIISSNISLLPNYAFPGVSDSKETACSAGDPGLIPGLGRSAGERNSNPLQYSCLEKSHEQRSLAGHSPWGHKESDMTTTLHFSLSSNILLPPNYASKYGKLSNGHRTGKGHFSSQSPKMATLKNVQTTAQLHSSHMLAK